MELLTVMVSQHLEVAKHCRLRFVQGQTNALREMG